MVLIAHGGATKKKPTKKQLNILAEALSGGYELLRSGGTATEAVVNVIAFLEDSGLFNAGLGGYLQLDGVWRLDASIMDGKDLRAGSVIGLEGIKNPIKAALMVTGTPHVMLTNRGAGEIAKGLEPLPEPDGKALERLQRIKDGNREIGRMFREYFSTVGAVALDRDGNLAAGASTGGIPVMLPGRVGDTPIIGAGVYADNSLGAVSCTGNGEAILKISLAKEICMQLGIMTPLSAARSSLKNILRVKGKAGVIVISKKGGFVIRHNSEYMSWGSVTGKKLTVGETCEEN